jgi:MFS family permease
MPLLIGPRAGALADRFGERVLILAGAVAMTGGMAWMAAVAAPGVGYLAVVGPMALAGVGLGLGIPAVTRAVVSRVTPADVGRASGTFSTLRQLGGAFGVAVLGTVFTRFGGYGSAAAFADGYMWVAAGAAVLAVGAVIAAFVVPRGGPAGTAAVTAVGHRDRLGRAVVRSGGEL